MPISDIFKNVSWFGEYEYEEPSPKKERRKKVSSPTEKFENVLTEAELKIELAHRFERSREYRIMLQEYQKKLRAREAELDEREATIEKKALAAQQRATAAVETLKKYQIALSETEYRSIDFLKRIDKKENQIFEEIRNNTLKFEKYSGTFSENGFVFESDFADVLRKNGFTEVVVTQKSQDYGADVLGEKDGVTYVFQCKYYTSAVGIEAIQQVIGAKIYYGRHVAVVATNSVFTHSAKTLAKEAGVLLWDGEKISTMQEQHQKAAEGR